MNRDGNMARQIRAMVETLHEWGYEYDGTGQLNARDKINDVAEQVGSLMSLPDPDDEAEDIEPDDEDCGADFEPSPDPNWMNP